MKNKNFKLLIGIALVGLLILTGRIYLNLTDGFTLNNITSEFAYRNQKTSQSVTEEELKKINEILNQPFYYLGRGAQTYAFESSDRKYVLKIVKQKHLKMSPLTHLLLQFPGLNNYREKRLNKYKKRVLSFLNCCHLTYDRLREESGLIYMHLDKTQGLHPHVAIYDKLNMSYQLPLDNYEFLIQKKGSLIYPFFSHLIQENPTVAYDMLEKLIQRLIVRSQRGVIDKDSPRKFSENVGFANGELIFIDFGEFSKSELIRHPAFHKAYIRLQTQDLQEWLYDQNEELAEKFNDLIEKINT